MIWIFVVLMKNTRILSRDLSITIKSTANRDVYVITAGKRFPSRTYVLSLHNHISQIQHRSHYMIGIIFIKKDWGKMHWFGLPPERNVYWLDCISPPYHHSIYLYRHSTQMPFSISRKATINIKRLYYLPQPPCVCLRDINLPYSRITQMNSR